MKLLPWFRADEDYERADQQVKQARSHIRVLVNELEKITRQIEAKAGGLADD